jgi:hypothetical protein
VPTPVPELFEYADADCTEYAFRLRTSAKPGATTYGVERATGDSVKVYELSPITRFYSRQTRVDIVMQDGHAVPVQVVTGCTSTDVTIVPSMLYRRGREVTEQFPTLGTVQLGSADLRPTWFFGKVAGSDTRILVQIHSPDGNWALPNIATSDGSVCMVYDNEDSRCVRKDGTSWVTISDVAL